MQKRLFILVLCVFLVSSFFALGLPAPEGFSEQKSYTWLENASVQQTDVVATSWAILALVSKNSPKVSSLVQNLEAQKDPGNCWPKGGCKAIDTALATVALSHAGQDVTSSLKTLQGDMFRVNAQQSGKLTGAFRLQIQATESAEGSCSIATKNADGGLSLPYTVTVKEGKLQGAAGDYYVHLAQVSGTGLLAPTFVVDCSSLTVGTILTLQFVNEQKNTYYLLDNRRAGEYEFVLPNVCYKSGVNSVGCDYEATAYVTWAIKEITGNPGSVGTSIYLKSQASNDDLHRAFLVRIFGSQRFADVLALQQGKAGDWSYHDIFKTSFSIFALETSSTYGTQVELGKTYLRNNVGNDGSWQKDVRKTSLALLALQGKDLPQSVVAVTLPVGTSTSSQEICENGIDDDKDSLIDCHDVDACSMKDLCVCDNGIQDIGEEGVDCGGSCDKFCLDDAASPSVEICMNKVDDDGNGDIDCEDIACLGDSFCAAVTPEEIPEEEPPVEEKPLSSWWLWLLLIIVVLGGGALLYYLAYVRRGKGSFGDLFSKKKPRVSFEEYKQQKLQKPAFAPSSERLQQPSRGVVRAPAERPEKKDTDDELDKSLREAEKLLYGDKKK